MGCGCHAEKRGFTAECVERPGRFSGRRVAAVERRIGWGADWSEGCGSESCGGNGRQGSLDKASFPTKFPAGPSTWRGGRTGRGGPSGARWLGVRGVPPALAGQEWGSLGCWLSCPDWLITGLYFRLLTVTFQPGKKPQAKSQRPESDQPSHLLLGRVSHLVISVSKESPKRLRACT